MSTSSTRAAVTARASTPARARVPRWITLGTLATVLAGLGVSAYLTAAHYTTTLTLACPQTATVNCEKVTTSPQSIFLGIPVAVLGLAFFTAMLPLCLPVAWRAASPLPHRIRLLASLLGVGFAAYLVYAELFDINAICLWCTTVHSLTVLLFALTALGTATATATTATAPPVPETGAPPPRR